MVRDEFDPDQGKLWNVLAYCCMYYTGTLQLGTLFNLIDL